MASKQAMEAAQNIANVEGWEEDANLEEIAEIIDAAFADVVAELVGLLRRVDEAGLNLLSCDLMQEIGAAIANHGGEA